MDIMGILWQFNIILSLIVFGINIGLAIGLAKLSKKVLALVSIGYGTGIFILTTIATVYSQQIINTVNLNSITLYLIMAVYLIIIGIIGIKDWKVHTNDTKTSLVLDIVAPAPCFLIIIVGSILNLVPTINYNTIGIEIIASITLITIITITYFITKKSASKHVPYQVSLGNFMIYTGAYFLIQGLLIPCILSIQGNQFREITIEILQIIIMLILVVVLIIIGIIHYRKNDDILK
ncbi:MAG: hypothetical protein BZ134_02410 [Methanosphaera sp. SHI1033]|nr:MAG: hypothetical protein BZ134_02410 [Methanosphaera sp. SHI1033]